LEQRKTGPPAVRILISTVVPKVLPPVRTPLTEARIWNPGKSAKSRLRSSLAKHTVTSAMPLPSRSSGTAFPSMPEMLEGKLGLVRVTWDGSTRSTSKALPTVSM
jgi:hypothetical protein